MEAAIALWHSATPTGACADSARPSRSPPSVMPSWFSRLAAALLGMLPWRRSSDPGACILLGEGRGEGMWASEERAGNVVLLRVPLAEFSDAAPRVGTASYRSLPGALTRAQTMQNRFVGDHLVYGFNDGSPGEPVEHPNLVWVYDLRRERVSTVALSHTVTRIERLGRDAMVIGPAWGGLGFSAIALDAAPTLASQHVAVGATHGDWRSHGFFFRAEGDRRGVIGLATMGERLADRRVTFVRVSDLRLHALGDLTSDRPEERDDCVASCTDWYGNIRPIFWRDRVFALMGYDLQEGDLSAGSVRARRRVDLLAPPRPTG